MHKTWIGPVSLDFLCSNISKQTLQRKVLFHNKKKRFFEINKDWICFYLINMLI